MSEAAALVALAATLAAAVARPRWAPEWLVALVSALLLVAVGVLSFHGARTALRQLGPKPQTPSPLQRAPANLSNRLGSSLLASTQPEG